MSFTEVFDMMYGMSAGRFGDGSCGIVGGSGKVLWRTEACRGMRFMKDDMLAVCAEDGTVRYVDLRNFTVYGSKPSVRRYGSIELLRTGGRFYSRTRNVYVSCEGVSGRDIRERGFYIAIPDKCMPAPYGSGVEGSGIMTQGYVCLLDGDDGDYYRINRRLADGSIVIRDGKGNYYHASEGKRKRLIGHDDTLREGGECRNRIELLTRRIKERCRRQEAVRRRQILERIKDAEPFKAGTGWGLRTKDRVIVPPVYRTVRNPVGRFCAVEVNYGQWGVITLDGKTVIEPKYQEVEIKDRDTAMLTRITGIKFSVKLRNV